MDKSTVEIDLTSSDPGHDPGRTRGYVLPSVRSLQNVRDGKRCSHVFQTLSLTLLQLFIVWAIQSPMVEVGIAWKPKPKGRTHQDHSSDS